MRNVFNTGSNDQCGTSPSRRCEASAPRRQGSSRAIALAKVPPLHWWRRLPADVFTGAHVRIIQKAISGLAILKEPRWREAAKGDPAAAIGIALRVTRRRGTAAPVIDLVMSAVLLAALSGDPVAALTMATMIKRKGARPERNALVTSWLGTPSAIEGSAAAVNKRRHNRLGSDATAGA